MYLVLSRGSSRIILPRRGVVPQCLALVLYLIVFPSVPCALAMPFVGNLTLGALSIAALSMALITMRLSMS